MLHFYSKNGWTLQELAEMIQNCSSGDLLLPPNFGHCKIELRERLPSQDWRDTLLHEWPKDDILDLLFFWLLNFDAKITISSNDYMLNIRLGSSKNSKWNPASDNRIHECGITEKDFKHSLDFNPGKYRNAGALPVEVTQRCYQIGKQIFEKYDCDLVTCYSEGFNDSPDRGSPESDEYVAYFCKGEEQQLVIVPYEEGRAHATEEESDSWSWRAWMPTKTVFPSLR